MTAGQLTKQWWVTCARCEDELRVHGPNQADATADARGNGWRKVKGQWVCSGCLEELHPPKAKRVVVLNTFHNTEVGVTAQPAGQGRYLVPADRLKRVRRTLCGMADCECHGDMYYEIRRRGELVEWSVYAGDSILLHNMERRG
jgi:hypothetical protein